MELEITFENKILIVVAKGVFTLDEAKRTFFQVLDAVKKYQALKVFVDGRQVKGQPTTMERFYYGEFCANEVAKFEKLNQLSPTFTYVIKEPVLDPGRFGENVAVNRGMKVKMFDNVADARSWIEQV